MGTVTVQLTGPGNAGAVVVISSQSLTDWGSLQATTDQTGKCSFDTGTPLLGFQGVLALWTITATSANGLDYAAGTVQTDLLGNGSVTLSMSFNPAQNIWATLSNALGAVIAFILVVVIIGAVVWVVYKVVLRKESPVPKNWRKWFQRRQDSEFAGG